MLVPLEGYQQAWKQIKQDSLSHSTYRLVLFVSCMDVDAFAAAMMLSVLLKKHLILYKTEPVVGYESLKRGFERLDPSIRNVLLVGCGANIDLEEFFNLENAEEEGRSRPKIHVFDCNRPWNLNNLYGNDFIYCYDDGSSEQLEPYREAYSYLASQPTNDDDDNGNDGDEEETELHLRRPAVIHSDDEDDEGGGKPDREPENIDDEEDERTQASDHGGSRENTQEDNVDEPPSKRRRTLTAKNTRILEEYYKECSSNTTTAAIAVYTLLTLIGETSLRSLWLAFVGVTAIEAKHPQLYRLLLPSLQDEMRRLNQTESNPQDRGAASSRGIRFVAEPDYSLFLLRQWSLYESMVHSSYVSAKMFLWREDGRKKLHKMLARVGITLQDARESWIHTRPSLKRELKSKLEGISGYYGIEGITRDGVVRHFGLEGSMSAGDCVESVAAYLETGRMPKGTAAASTSWDSPVESEVSDQEATPDIWIRNFWTAWDSMDNYDRLRLGAEQAKTLQRAVVATSNFIFEKNLPRDLHSFRMVIVQDAPEIAVFLNPLSLQRLAVWISESCAEIHTSNIPLVLAVLNEPRDIYLVFGVSGNQDREQLENTAISSSTGNFFGRKFQSTALKINARVRVDAFDSSIIEVSREDLPRFLEALDLEIRR